MGPTEYHVGPDRRIGVIAAAVIDSLATYPVVARAAHQCPSEIGTESISMVSYK